MCHNKLLPQPRLLTLCLQPSYNYTAVPINQIIVLKNAAKSLGGKIIALLFLSILPWHFHPANCTVHNVFCCGYRLPDLQLKNIFYCASFNCNCCRKKDIFQCLSCRPASKLSATFQLDAPAHSSIRIFPLETYWKVITVHVCERLDGKTDDRQQQELFLAGSASREENTGGCMKSEETLPITTFLFSLSQ